MSRKAPYRGTPYLKIWAAAHFFPPPFAIQIRPHQRLAYWVLAYSALAIRQMVMHKDTMQGTAHPMTFGQYLRCRTTVNRALKVSAIVGTILIAINQGDAIIAGAWPPLWKIILTYMVPYSVSSYSTAALLLDQQRSAGKTEQI